MSTPEPVIEILRRLEAAGHETWCVGGAIRDQLLDHPGSDVDIATAARPDQVRKLFGKTIPVGIDHGTVGVLDEYGVLHEVTTFRRDVKSDGRRAQVEFGVTLDDDLARRDFTINAIAYHPLRDEFRDPFDGRGDLAKRVVRAVGDPVLRFHEDRLRILRALRFAARFAFTIDPDTWAAARSQAADTLHLSAERVRGEWWKGIATAAQPIVLARLWEGSGIADAWLGTGRHPLPEELPRDPVLALAAWCNSVESVLQRLKCSSAEIARGRRIDRGPVAPGSTDGVAVRRWMAVVGKGVDDLIALATVRSGSRPDWADQVSGVRARREPIERGDLVIGGDDLVAAGVASGPALGAVLERLLDAVIDSPSLNTREALLELALAPEPPLADGGSTH